MQIIKTTTIMTTEQIENRVNQQLLGFGLKQKDSQGTHDQESFDYYIELITKLNELLKVQSFILGVNTGGSSKEIIESNITIIQFSNDYDYIKTDIIRSKTAIANILLENEADTKMAIANILLENGADSWVWHSDYGTIQLFINFPY